MQNIRGSAPPEYTNDGGGGRYLVALNPMVSYWREGQGIKRFEGHKKGGEAYLWVFRGLALKRWVFLRGLKDLVYREPMVLRGECYLVSGER